MATNMTVITRNPETYEEETFTITDINPELFPESGTVPVEVYQAADTVARRFAGLSNNTYVDAIIARSESLTEILNA